MQTLNFSSTEEIRERLDTLEDSEVIDSSDIEVWYARLGGEDTEIIQEVEIARLGLRYVNDGEADEGSDLRMYLDGQAEMNRGWRA